MKSLAIVGLSFLATTPIGSAQQTAPIFRSGVSLVALNVTVTDPNKRYVTGLSASDFAVFENGVQQDVQFFESGSVPVDLIVLLDTSSSMRPRMEVVHKAALGFLNTLRERDRGAIVAFNDRVEIVQPLTADRAALERAVKSAPADGGTALRNALYIALRQFGGPARQSGDVRRQAIAVLSDGEDTASVVSFDDVLEVARTSGVAVYPISLQSDPSAAAARPPSTSRLLTESQYSMRQLADETGGRAFFPGGISELAGIYSSIAQELATQYSIGYSPSDSRFDGRLRRILVRVITRPELRPRARTGYVGVPERMARIRRDPR